VKEGGKKLGNLCYRSSDKPVLKIGQKKESRNSQRSCKIGKTIQTIILTPLKKRAKLDLRSSFIEAGYEVTIAEVIDNLGTSDSLILSNLQMEWKKIGKNFETIKELLDGTRGAIRALSTVAQEEFGKSDVELSRLQTLVGSRTEDMGTMSAFDMIGIAIEDLNRLVPLEEFVESHSGSWERDLEMKIEKAARAAGGTPMMAWKTSFLLEIRQQIEPVFRLFAKLSSSFQTPGDLINKQLSKVHADVLSLKVQLGSNTTSFVDPSQSPSMWGNLGMGLNPSPTQQTVSRASQGKGLGQSVAGSQVNTDVLARITSIEATVKALEDQLHSNRVDVAGISFKSRAS
jgi:hypothetical protein